MAERAPGTFDGTCERATRWLASAALVAIATTLAACLVEGPQRLEHRISTGVFATDRDITPAQLRPIATAGAGETAATDVDTASSPALIQDVETITGSIDGHELIGRRVMMHVVVQRLASPLAFWAGPRGNAVLVVGPHHARAARGRHADQTTHDAVPMHAGQEATVWGTIQRVPATPADAWGWTPSTADTQDLVERNIYVRADRITPVGG